MADPATWIFAIGAIAGAIGGGISAYGQHQQGKAQNAIAQFNATQQQKQAEMQLLSMQTQAALQKQQGEANFSLRSAEAQARFTNADAKSQQALAQDAVNRVNLRERREDYAKMQATQRTNIAASGVAEASGTPLDLLAETAAKIQLDLEEQHFAGEMQRRTLFAEAATERLGGRLALAGATLDRDSAVTEAALRDAAGRAEYSAGLSAAEITRLTGRAAKQAANYNAAATLFSGISSTTSDYLRYKPTKTGAPKTTIN